MSDFCLHLCLICIFVITANILSYVASLQCSVLRRKRSSIHTTSETIHHLEKWGTQRSVMCSTNFNHHFNFIYINKSGLLASECSSAEKRFVLRKLHQSPPLPVHITTPYSAFRSTEQHITDQQWGIQAQQGRRRQTDWQGRPCDLLAASTFY